MVPAAKGVGYGQIIGTASVVSYYCCLIALAIHYLFSSCQSVLPWTVCHTQFAEENVLCIDGNSSSINISSISNTSNSNNQSIISAAEQYFKRGVLKVTDSIDDGIGMPDLQLSACLADD